MRQSYAPIKNNVIKAAEKMPASDYSFRTVPEVRTYGEMIAHIADARWMWYDAHDGDAAHSTGVNRFKRFCFRLAAGLIIE